MDEKPLLKLIIGNLRKAYLLGMIECDELYIDDYVNSVINGWNSATIQEDEYKQWMANVNKVFLQRFRPLQAYKGEKITFYNILKLGDFTQYWLFPEYIAPSFGTDEYKAKMRILELCKTTKPASLDDFAQLDECFIKIGNWVSEMNNGIAVRIGAILDDVFIPRQLWVSADQDNTELSAQFWRDQLGLIHINTQDPLMCQERLVRLKFTVQVPDDELPRDRHLDHRSVMDTLLWLFRPSVVHLGNRRFVQGMSLDKASNPNITGRTRVLSSAYPEGENELLLLAGAASSCRLTDINLLNGFACKNQLDDDDNIFINSICKQFEKTGCNSYIFY